MSIEKKRCPKGHFYNANKFDMCPLCNPELMEKASKVVTENDGELPRVSTASGWQKPIETRGTIGFFDEQAGSGIQGNSVLNDVNMKKSETEIFEDSDVTVTEMWTDNECIENKTQDAVIPSLKEQMHTMKNKQIEDQVTVAQWGGTQINPVVGWLVCISGAYIGETFEIKSGLNRIGRSLEMDIHLSCEGSVSRHTHSKIVYDPENHEFYIQSGESNGLTYLNGKLILSPEKMKEYDEIKIAKAKFIVIPFCDKEHNWNVF